MNYTQTLELESREIKARINQLYKALKEKPTAFDSIVSEINSLRVNLQAKKDRKKYMNRPVPYMTDIQVIPVRK